jgi:hypothetical protein
MLLLLRRDRRQQAAGRILRTLFITQHSLCTGCAVRPYHAPASNPIAGAGALPLCEPTCGVNRAAAYVALLVEPVVRVVVLTG